MEQDERFLIMLRREGEPDRVPSFIQGIMPLFMQEWDEKYGDSITDEDFCPTDVKDFTMVKHLGFDSSWCGTPSGHRVFSEASDKLWKKMNDELPKEEKEKGYKINRNGARVHVGTLNGLPYTYTHEGILKTPELFMEWYKDSYITDPPEHAIERINRTIKKGLEKDILPMFTSHMISEPAIATISILGVSKWSRKHPNELKKAFDIIMESSMQKIDLLCQSDAPIIMVPDDCAYKGRPIYNPKIYEDFFIPHWRKIAKKAHKHDKPVIFHSDGYVEPYYPLLIEAGIDAHQSLEPIAGMDLKHLKETYGDRFTLIGNIDVSRLIPYGSKQQVVDAVKDCLRYGAPGGGYILSPCSDFTNSCKLENAITMMETYKKYRNYPISIPE
ncbi:MAG: hypothetical protein GF364_18085 [Candidatus Lokiarchaeota archaeon]|nr:hypothetical protein [Candidatus Lokiarchaeota archaeon]